MDNHEKARIENRINEAIPRLFELIEEQSKQNESWIPVTNYCFDDTDYIIHFLVEAKKVIK